MLDGMKDEKECLLGSLENGDNSSLDIMDIGSKLSTVEVIET